MNFGPSRETMHKRLYYRQILRAVQQYNTNLRRILSRRPLTVQLMFNINVRHSAAGAWTSLYVTKQKFLRQKTSFRLNNQK